MVILQRYGAARALLLRPPPPIQFLHVGRATVAELGGFGSRARGRVGLTFAPLLGSTLVRPAAINMALATQ